jgi:hypothetical protein
MRYRRQRPVSRLRFSGTPFACRRRGTGLNRETLESYLERAHPPWSARRRRVQRPRVRHWFSALRRRSAAHHGDLGADAAPPTPMATAPQRHTTVAERPVRSSHRREEPRTLGSARGLPELARRRSVSTAKSRSDREAVDNPSSGADLRRTHQCPPDRWTPLTQMPLTRAPRRTRSTRVGSVSSSSRSCRGRRAFRSWSVFTPPPIWGDSSAANPVRGESAPLGSARILPSAWSWHRLEELLAVGER